MSALGVSLKQLLEKAAIVVPNIAHERLHREVTGIVYDSRKVERGNIFVALEGLSTDGHDYIPDAVRRGAVGIVGTKHINLHDIPYIQVDDSRRALAQLSAAFYDFPARKLTVIGVTGTDGKTTTSTMIFKILSAAGYRAGMISTVSAVIGGEELDTGFHVTTPEAPDVQRYLAMMVERGITHVVLEATSHGLEQQRVAACEFDIAVVTNIQHEHLDYHGSYDNYLAAKAKLIRWLMVTQEKGHGNYRIAVLNKDDISFTPLMDICKEVGLPQENILTYGYGEDVQYRGRLISNDGLRITFEIDTPRKRVRDFLHLKGEYNVYNALAAVSATVGGLGVDLYDAIYGLRELTYISGRMERIDLGQSFSVFVDFAHTPNALKQALSSCRKMTQGRVIAVFGSAGLRDKEKRRLMAEISVKYADKSIFTAEDPRTEDLDQILAEMAKGAEMVGAREKIDYFRIRDRGEAIRFALSLAKEDDIVIVCGKGHEQSMCFGVTEYPWDDRVAVRAALAELLDISGPEMPYLPTQDE